MLGERLADPAAHEVGVSNPAGKARTAAQERGEVGQRAGERQRDVVVSF